MELRDVGLAAGMMTVRSGIAGRARRLPLHRDAQRLVARYLDKVRCPNGVPLLLIRIEMNKAGHPWQAGISQRVAQLVVRQLGIQAAAQLAAEGQQESSLERAEQLRRLAQRLEVVTPHQLRHSLAQRMLKSGAQLGEVQRVLGHSRLSTTGVYLTPNEDDLRSAIDKAGV